MFSDDELSLATSGATSRGRLKQEVRRMESNRTRSLVLETIRPRLMVQPQP